MAYWSPEYFHACHPSDQPVNDACLDNQGTLLVRRFGRSDREEQEYNNYARQGEAKAPGKARHKHVETVFGIYALGLLEDGTTG